MVYFRGHLLLKRDHIMRGGLFSKKKGKRSEGNEGIIASPREFQSSNPPRPDFENIPEDGQAPKVYKDLATRQRFSLDPVPIAAVDRQRVNPLTPKKLFSDDLTDDDEILEPIDELEYKF